MSDSTNATTKPSSIAPMVTLVGKMIDEQLPEFGDMMARTVREEEVREGEAVGYPSPPRPYARQSRDLAEAGARRCTPSKRYGYCTPILIR